MSAVFLRSAMSPLFVQLPTCAGHLLWGPSTLLSTILRASAKASAGVENGVVAASRSPSLPRSKSSLRDSERGAKTRQ
jgi:hypothetical protein